MAVSEITMNTDTQAEILALYSASIADIGWFKSQQWQVAYYSLAAQGAIAAVAQVVNLDSDVGKALVTLPLVAASIWVAFQSILIVRDIDDALTKTRERLAYARGHLSDAFRGAFGGFPARDWESKRARPSWLMQQAIAASILLCCSVVLAGQYGNVWRPDCLVPVDAQHSEGP